ncbi:MAG: polyprenyl synthetase family protein [Bacilli bacterium]
MKWLNHQLAKSVKEVDRLLATSIASQQPLVDDACQSLLASGGKRIRPLLVVICSKFGQLKENEPDVLRVAASLELVHMASLVHDDVIDRATLRRGKPTINAKYDDRSAMYIGDFLFAQAVLLLSETNEPKLQSVLAETIVEVCLGEIDQIYQKYRWNQTYTTYLRRMKRKTALLIAVSCAMGGMSRGADEATVDLLYRYGYNVGMSFQIMDDLLDYTSTEAVLGKPVASDLRSGHVTMPAFIARRTPELWAQITAVRADTSDQHIHTIISEMRTLGVFEEVERLSNQYLEKALSYARQLPQQRERDMLIEIANQIGRRKK